MTHTTSGSALRQYRVASAHHGGGVKIGLKPVGEQVIAITGAFGDAD